MKKYLIISKSVYETKLALLEDNKLDEMYIERNNQKEITGKCLTHIIRFVTL